MRKKLKYETPELEVTKFDIKKPLMYNPDDPTIDIETFNPGSDDTDPGDLPLEDFE